MLAHCRPDIGHLEQPVVGRPGGEGGSPRNATQTRQSGPKCVRGNDRFTSLVGPAESTGHHRVADNGSSRTAVGSFVFVTDSADGN